jgi:two-component system, NtrC family, sensor kinase
MPTSQPDSVDLDQLQALGRLAACIADEVNTPTQYVTDNVSFLQRAFDKLWHLIEAQSVVVEVARAAATPAQLEQVDAARAAAKLDYLARQVPRAIEQSLAGLGQVSSLVRAVRELSQASATDRQPVDIHELIESTSTIAKSEWKYVAELELDFDWSLPLLTLRKTELSGQLLKLIVNASRAIGAALPAGSSDKGKIVISTKLVAPNVEVRVTDTGTGTTSVIALPLSCG